MRPLALAISLTALGLAACSRGGLPPAQVQAWVGRPAANLIREWGTPTKEVTEAGERVLIYEEVEQTGSAEFSRQVSSATKAAGEPAPNSATIGYSSYARSYLFWVDPDGKITRAQIRQP